VDALGLGGDPAAGAVVGAVQARTGRSKESIVDLLYGATPPDDPALVRLASALDELVRATLEETR
jgi:hypothetical protein